MTVQLTAGPEIGLVVKDPETMMLFYRDGLGLQVDSKAEFPGIRLWWLKCGAGWIKLVHQESPPPAANPPGGMEGATGLRYITLRVENVDQAAADAQAGGGRLVFENSLDVLKMAMVEDPEGNFVEFVRWAGDGGPGQGDRNLDD